MRERLRPASVSSPELCRAFGRFGATCCFRCHVDAPFSIQELPWRGGKSGRRPWNGVGNLAQREAGERDGGKWNIFPRRVNENLPFGNSVRLLTRRREQ